MSDPSTYAPRFTFDEDTKNYYVVGPSLNAVRDDVVHTFNRDVDGKVRAALVELGWAPPERVKKLEDGLRAILDLPDADADHRNVIARDALST